jgi:hypothetical protein
MVRELRPRFEVRSDEAPSVVLERLHSRLRSRDCPLKGYVAEERAVLHVPPSRQHLWSAELRLDVKGRDDGGAVVEGMYAPHPHVWITYVIVLAAVVVGVTVALVFALAQWSMNERPVALYALVPLLVLGAVTYGLAFVGQGFATEEMDELRAFLDEALEPPTALRSEIRNRDPRQREAV